MADSWNEMKRAKEEAYFEQQNKEAMARLKAREGQKARLSPITGQPMEQITVHGVVVDRCPTSGYIGLDAGELEQIVKASGGGAEKEGWINSLFSKLSKY